jgi:predicted enzyme related to lactoylglutathione lyase
MLPAGWRNQHDSRSQDCQYSRAQPGCCIEVLHRENRVQGGYLFTPPGQENRIGGFQPMTFWCDDVFATAEIFKSKGVELAAEPKKEVWGTMAKFKDPDGNEFVFSSR